MSFEFETNLEELDYRADFANRVLKLIYQKHKGDLYLANLEAEPFYEDFEELIRNIYELVDTQIPMYSYYRLVKYGKDNWGFTDIEYEQAGTNSMLACSLYYT